MLIVYLDKFGGGVTVDGFSKKSPNLFVFERYCDIIYLFKSTHYANVVVPFLFCSWYNKGTTKNNQKGETT